MPVLKGLPDTRRALIAVNINCAGDIRAIVEARKGATTAADRGAVTFWRDDQKRLRGEISQYRRTVAEKFFGGFDEMEATAGEWLRFIGKTPDAEGWGR